jgi:hypothetical protein
MWRARVTVAPAAGIPASRARFVVALDARARAMDPRGTEEDPMDDAPLIPSPLFGLRTWRVVADDDGDRLTAAHRGTPWPAGGAWLSARCGSTPEHDAPAPGCHCGIHAYHPSARAARRMLGVRAEVPGIVEASGMVELHEEGFRASRARPYALFAAPRRNARAVERLARRYGVPVVTVASADEIAAYCREHGLGLDPAIVAGLLGPERAGEARHERRRARRQGTLRAIAYAAIVAVVAAIGLQFLSGPPSPKGVYGRTGWVILPQTTRSPPPRKAAAPSVTAVPAARETTRARRSRCAYGGTDHRARHGRRGSGRSRAARRRCRPR